MAGVDLEIFDMDGVLIHFSEKAGVDPFIQGVHVRLLPHMPEVPLDEDFRQACRDEHMQEGCCLTGFKKRLGLRKRWLLDSYRHINHHYLTPAILPLLQEDRELVDRLDRLASRPDKKLVCFTQADRSYAFAALKKIGVLGTIFKREDVHDIRWSKGALKRDVETFHMLKRARPGYRGYFMTEDTPGNLVGAKLSGMDTSKVGDKPVTEVEAQHIDRAFDTIYELLDYKIAA